ncbi:MAG: hypothetical protein AB7S48_14385 [Bacteroidales bacterium]
MYKKFTILFIGLSLMITNKSNAQSNLEDFNSPIRHGYIIINDSIYKQGFIVLATDKSNAEYVDFLKYTNADPERLSIKDIKEYGYNDVVYVAIPYKKKIVFMQQLNSKEPFIYYYKSKNCKEFFIMKDNSLVLLPSDIKELRNFLKSEFANCSISCKNVQIAIYNKQRLKYIFERNSTCDAKRIPRFNYGVSLGSTISHLKLNPRSNIPSYTEGDMGNSAISIRSITFNKNVGYVGGFFLDIPLSVQNGKLSFHPEFEFKSVNYNFDIDTKSVNDNLEVNTDSKIGFDINYYTINLFTRYKSLNRRLAPFFDFGLVYSILNVTNPYYKNSSSSLPSYIYPNLSNSIYGLGLGGGVSLPILNRNYIDISLRYTFLINQDKMPNVSSLDFVVGIEI